MGPSSWIPESESSLRLRLRRCLAALTGASLTGVLARELGDRDQAGEGVLVGDPIGMRSSSDTGGGVVTWPDII